MTTYKVYLFKFSDNFLHLYGVFIVGWEGGTLNMVYRKSNMLRCERTLHLKIIRSNPLNMRLIRTESIAKQLASVKNNTSLAHLGEPLVSQCHWYA